MDLDRIADAIDGADVVALQEVERHWPRSEMLDQPKELAKRLPEYWWVFGANIDLHSRDTVSGEEADRRRQFGNMLMARRPILASRNKSVSFLLRVEPERIRRGFSSTPGGTRTPNLLIRRSPNRVHKRPHESMRNGSQLGSQRSVPRPWGACGCQFQILTSRHRASYRRLPSLSCRQRMSQPISPGSTSRASTAKVPDSCFHWVAMVASLSSVRTGSASAPP